MRAVLCRRTWTLVAVLMTWPATVGAQTGAWSTYAGNPQHTGLSTVAASPLVNIRWQTPVDLDPPYSGNDLFIHYGSPLATAANTKVVPVRTSSANTFRVEAHGGLNGALTWTRTTDYAQPPHGWIPSFSPTLTPTDRLYYAGAGGTVFAMDNANTPAAGTPPRLAFFGNANYNANPAAYNANVFINTPITSDGAGNVYFGYQVTGATPIGLQSGIARITPDGTGTFTSAATAAADGSISKVIHNCAPALSSDGSTLYVGVTTANGTGFGNGYLLALNSTTLAPINRVDLRDVRNPGNRANLPEDGSASPTVGPNGDVFFGVLENPFNSSKGWLLHFNGTLTQPQTAGAFGWDDTAGIVPRSMVPSYNGTSAYLIMTKYNNYAGAGGDGKNKLAILDPNDTQIDPRTGATVMKEILTVLGPTPDPEFPNQPGAVREWCINTAAIDPFTDSIMANSEDGKLYRWDLTTNTLSEVVTLTPGIGEAYTPTVIGPDGTVYAINNATLFAVNAIPEPSSVALVAAGGAALAGLVRKQWQRRRVRRVRVSGRSPRRGGTASDTAI